MNECATINGIRLYLVKIPFVTPFRISGGVSFSRKSLIVELHSDGITGWGETSPFEAPFYSSETVNSVRVIIEGEMIPRVTGKTFENIEHIKTALGENVRGNPFARAAIETAYWDLIARKNGLPLKPVITKKLEKYGTTAEYLKSNNYLVSGVSVGIPEDMDLRTLKKWVAEFVEDGYQRIKLKVSPEWNVSAVKTAREVVGADMQMWVDGNASFDIDEHLETLRSFDSFNLCFLEQPLNNDDLFFHGKLSKLVKTPICLDESMKSLMWARACVEGDISKIWNIKVHRMGGLLEAVKVYAYASIHGVKVWGGTMPESGIGSMSIANLASFAGFAYPTDIEDSARWFGKGNDLIEIRMDSKGSIYLDETAPGIGVVNMDNFRRYATLLVEIGEMNA